MKVLVIGASGFVGRHLSQALLDGGHAVRCLARQPSKVADLASAGCDVVQGDILDLPSLQRALASVEAVYITIHTLSQQHPSASGQGFMDVEMNGLKNIVNACKSSGSRRLVYLTSMGTSPKARSVWLRERWKTEQFILHCGLDATVIRPGQIVGAGGQGFDLMVASAKRPFALDLFGNGKQKMQNIAVSDLVYYLVGVLEDLRTYGQAYNVGGDDILTNSEMIDIAADVLGKRHPAKVHLPRALIGVAAPLLESSAKLPKGSVRAILDGTTSPMTGDCTPIRKVLPKPPLSYRSAVEQAISGAKSSNAPAKPLVPGA